MSLCPRCHDDEIFDEGPLCHDCLGDIELGRSLRGEFGPREQAETEQAIRDPYHDMLDDVWAWKQIRMMRDYLIRAARRWT